MEINLVLIYKCVQAAAVLLMAGWIVCSVLVKAKGAGIVLRGLAMFASIASLILLYLSVLETVKLPVWIYLGISGVVFLVFALDKMLAVIGEGNFRIPENVLLVFSLFGILGGISGMVVFHHKNKKAKLQYVMPIIAIVEIGVFYLIRLRNFSFKMADLKSLNIFQYLTIVTTVILCLMLIRTFILVRLLVIIPISIAAAFFSVEFCCKMGSSVTITEMIRTKPIPFFAVAVVVFVILELISVKSKFITSGNEVRQKTDHHSSTKEEEKVDI